MKWFILLTAVILAASALPTEIDRNVDVGQKLDFGENADFGEEMDFDQELFETYVPAETNEASTFNRTARNAPGLQGFATMNGGTVGGAGGSVWTVWDAWALRDAIAGNDRRIVHVRGRIDLTVLFTSSPGVSINVGSHKTILGTDRNAMIFGGGLSLNGVRNVIIENLRMHNALSYAQNERPNGNGGIIGQVPGPFSHIDNVGILNSENVWVTHCEFADDPWNANSVPDNQRRHDGLCDITNGANHITISHNIFRNHNLVMLIGNSDTGAQDRGRLKVTMHNNWFQGTSQRNPRVRFGEVHIFNNLFTDISSYGIGAGVAAQIYCENNVFRNTRRAWGFPAGTPNPMGFLLATNNLLHNSQHDANIPSNGVTFRPNNYYWYGRESVHTTEDTVRRTAGPR